MHVCLLLLSLVGAQDAALVGEHDEAGMFGGEGGSPPAADGAAPTNAGDGPGFGDVNARSEGSGADGATSGSDASTDGAAPIAASAHDEDAMFGDPAAAPTDAAATPSRSSSTGAPEGGLLSQADDALTLGGQLFLRLNGAFRENTAVEDGPVNAPSLLDAFADVRPNDRVRGFAQLRFSFDPTIAPGELNAFGGTQSPFDLRLAQAWAKFDLGRIAYVTVGRQRIRWGTGRFWNPTDFINQEIRNSVDFFDQRVGVDIVKVHFPFEQLGWNLYLIGLIGGLDVVGDGGLAARAEFVLGEAELAVSSLVQRDAPLRLGLDASAGIGLFDVKAEAVVSRGLARKLFAGELDFQSGTLPDELDTDDDWFFEGVVGAEASFKYTDTDTFSIGAEYFYNQAGYDSAKIYPFLFFNNAYVPLYTGRHYGAVYVFVPGPFSWDDLNLTLSTLGNISDRSFLTRFDVQWVVLQYLTINTFVAGHWGSVGEFKLGLDIPPVPGVPQLAEGLRLENELIDVGFAARVNF
jgi:hypothetical protein